MLAPIPIALVIALAVGVCSTGAATKRGHHAPPPIVAVGQPTPASMYSASGVSCGDTLHCVAVGLGTGTAAAIDATANGGTTWAARVVPASVNVLAAVSCADKLECVAVGTAGAAGAVVSTVDGGVIWSLDQAPAGAAAVTAIDCTSKRDCIALATDGMTYWSAFSTNGGATWVRGGNLPSAMTTAPDGLTCTSAQLCLAAGYSPTKPGAGAGAIASTADGGATWVAVTLPTGVGLIRGLSCADTTCVAVGTTSTATTGFVPGSGQLLTSADDGGTWEVADGPELAHDDAFAASCPNKKTCVVVGTDWVGKTQPLPTGSIVTTLDAGVQWRSATLHYIPVGMDSVSCPVVNRCVAVGGNVLAHLALPVALPVPKPKVAPGTRHGSGAR
jgi:hypothetical protein